MVNTITDWGGAGNVSVDGSPTYHDHGDHLEVEVPANQGVVFTVHDSGLFENILINQEAGGAYHRVRTPGTTNLSSNFEIRNIGVSGEHGDDSMAWVIGSSDSNSIIEHIYLGDGIEGWYPGISFDGAGGMMAGHGHSGHLVVRGVYLDQWGDNGIYLSQPQAPSLSQGMGSFGVEECYVARTDHAGIRLATPGSYARDCVCREIYNRAFEARPRQANDWEITFENCHGHSVLADEGFWGAYGLNLGGEGYAAYAELVGDCQFWGERDPVNFIDGSQIVSGDYGTNPTETVPDACPQSAIEAATGDGSVPGPVDNPVCVRDVVDG